MLSDSEHELEDIHQLTINEHYAKAFARRKEREELTKLKEKYGSDVNEDLEGSEDSEEDMSEDEDGEELTPAVDAAILRTLARIRHKDPSIYDLDKDVFEEERKRTSSIPFSNSARKDKDKSKPVFLKQHILASALRETSRSPSPVPAEPTHIEEQVALKKETISVFHSAVKAASDVSDEEDFLVPREKTKDEIEREEEEYREYLAREVGDDIHNLITIEKNGVEVDEEHASAQEGLTQEKSESKEEKKEKKKAKGKSGRTKEAEDHEFLIHYILNRGWIDRSSRKMPTYNDVTGGSSKGTKDETSREGINGSAGAIEASDARESHAEGPEELDEDEFDNVADNFESSYNFRFEEPDAAIIKSHPRSIATTVRREENPRKVARERRKARKEEKMRQKKDEIKRLKSLKVKEIQEKLDRIKKEGGKSANDEALNQLDLEGEWDPDAHDAQMGKVFENNDDDDMEKPTWDDDIDITDIVPEIKEPTTSTSKKRNKDRKKRKRDGIEDEHMDEVYGYDFNDMIGDMPIRFKYTRVAPQSYGLAPTEILLANEVDLNNYVGLKKLAPYRKDKGRSWDSKRVEKLKEFRKTLHERYGSLASNEKGARGDETNPKKKKKGKRERQKAKLLAEEAANGPPAGTIAGEEKITKEAAHDQSNTQKERKRSHKNASAKEDG